MIPGLLARLLTPVLGLLLAVALAMAGWHAHQAGEISAEFSDYRAAAERQERAREAAARTDEARTRSKQSEAQDDAFLSLKLSADDGRRADAAAGRLRQRADALAASARCPASDPATAASSPPADPASDLLADMLRRVDDAAGTIGRYADEARPAGQLCERSYDALTPP
jgi:hypothetical protein